MGSAAVLVVQDMGRHYLEQHKNEEWFRERYLPSKQLEALYEPKTQHAQQEVVKFAVRRLFLTSWHD